MNCKSKIKTRDELKKIIQQHKKNGDIIVQCHGCFDVLHPGHIRYLQFAKSLGDILVVSITGDDFIYKGDDRPFIPEELRAEAVASLQFVDYVYLDYESWAGPILKYLKPDIYVKGKEYENIFTGRFGEERKIVESYGGKVYFGSGDVVFSSSKKTKNKNIIITLGENGLLIFKNKVYKTTQGEIHLASEYLPAIGKNVLDPMGAGDAMLATIALSVSAGGTIEQSAYLGNIVSFFEVNKIGNRPVNLKEIMDFLSLREELTGNSYSLPSTAPLVSIK